MARTKLPPNDLYIGDVKVINANGTYAPVETPQEFAVEQKAVSTNPISIVHAEVEFTSTGGLDSEAVSAAAVNGVLKLSAGTTSGTYAPVESNIVLPTGAKAGDELTFFKMNVSGAAASEFDDEGFIFAIDGVTVSDDADAAVQEAEVAAVGSTHALRISVNGDTYYIPMHTAVDFETEVDAS